VQNEKIEEIVREVLKELTQKLENSRPAASSIPEEESAGSEPIQFPEHKQMGVDAPHNPAIIQRAQQVTPARIGIGRTGTRMKTTSYLQFRIDHAAAQDAVMRDVPEEVIADLVLPVVKTRASDMRTYLMNLDAGRRLSEESAEWLSKNGDKGKNVQILVCDGLSSSAVEATVQDLLPALIQGLNLKKITMGKPLFVRRARVWAQDHAASIVDCDAVISLIGERPGLATAESVSAYIIYRPNENTVEADRTVISNIHKGGLSPVEAGAYLADIIGEILEHKASGIAYAKRRNK
jgi:ethanolamine ammonia-lyase small subunit